MCYLTASLGIVLAMFALLQIGQPDGLIWASVFGSGALLAFLTLKRAMPLMLSRLLAILSSVAMFSFFAAFFRLAPGLHDDWYGRAAAIDAIGLLFAGFAMIMILSEYSCRMKRGECSVDSVGQSDPHFPSSPHSRQHPPSQVSAHASRSQHPRF
jgi:hypothetical protein